MFYFQTDLINVPKYVLEIVSKMQSRLSEKELRPLAVEFVKRLGHFRVQRPVSDCDRWFNEEFVFE